MNIGEFVLSFVILMIEFRIIFGIWQKSKQKSEDFRSYMTKIGTFFIVYHATIAIFFPIYRFSGLTLVVAPILFILLFNFISRLKKFRKRDIEYLLFLRGVELQMLCGKSFNEAFVQNLLACNGKSKEYIAQLWDFVSFSQQKTPKELAVQVNQLRILSKSQHQTREKLCGYINKLQIEHDIRHRSRQILAGAKIQAVILSIVFVFLLFFVTVNFGIRANLRLVLVSTALFTTGVALIIYCGGKMKWKV